MRILARLRDPVLLITQTCLETGARISFRRLRAGVPLRSPRTCARRRPAWPYSTAGFRSRCVMPFLCAASRESARLRALVHGHPEHSIAFENGGGARSDANARALPCQGRRPHRRGKMRPSASGFGPHPTSGYFQTAVTFRITPPPAVGSARGPASSAGAPVAVALQRSSRHWPHHCFQTQ